MGFWSGVCGEMPVKFPDVEMVWSFSVQENKKVMCKQNESNCPWNLLWVFSYSVLFWAPWWTRLHGRKGEVAAIHPGFY